METTSIAQTSSTSGMSTTTAESTAELEESYDLFLSILTAQLENQNPLDPTDTDEMTSQLLQYSQIEQQILTNEYMESLVLSTNNQSAETALGFVGMDVTYDGSTQAYSGQDLTWNMDVPQDAQSLTFEILNENGLEVYETTETPSGGSYDFVWNGSTAGNGTAAFGDYTLQVTANYADGTSSDVPLQSTSRATEVTWATGAPELVLSNGSTIGLDVIVSAKEPLASGA